MAWPTQRIAAFNDIKMATTITTEAVVLRTYNLAEADKIVVCLTRESGLLRGVAKGARKLKSRFGAGLEPFTIIRLRYRAHEERELVILEEAEIVRGYFAIAREPSSLETWAYLSELVLSLIPPHEPNPKLFDLFRACLSVLAEQPQEAPAIRVYFSIWLLKFSGLLPGWHLCLRCHAPLVPVVGVYIDGHYYMYCAACRPATARLWPLAAYTLLRATRQQGPAEFIERTRAGGLEELENMTRRLLQAAL